MLAEKSRISSLTEADNSEADQESLPKKLACRLTPIMWPSHKEITPRGQASPLEINSSNKFVH